MPATWCVPRPLTYAQTQTVTHMHRFKLQFGLHKDTPIQTYVVSQTDITRTQAYEWMTMCVYVCVCVDEDVCMSVWPMSVQYKNSYIHTLGLFRCTSYDVRCHRTSTMCCAKGDVTLTTAMFCFSNILQNKIFLFQNSHYS